jgi:hypothetical protein
VSKTKIYCAECEDLLIRVCGSAPREVCILRDVVCPPCYYRKTGEETGKSTVEGADVGQGAIDAFTDEPDKLEEQPRQSIQKGGPQ